MRLVTDACAGWNRDRVGRENRTEWHSASGLHVLTREKVQQEYAMFMCGGPPAHSKMRYAADTLALAVGDDSGSRLYWALVDPGHADSADCSYVENDGSGAVYVSLSGEPENRRQSSAWLECHRHAEARISSSPCCGSQPIVARTSWLSE